MTTQPTDESGNIIMLEDVMLCPDGRASTLLKNYISQKIRDKMMNLVQAQHAVQNTGGFQVGSLYASSGSHGYTYGGLGSQVAQRESEFSSFIEGIEVVIDLVSPNRQKATRWIEGQIRKALGNALKRYATANHPLHPDHVSTELEA